MRRQSSSAFTCWVCLVLALLFAAGCACGSSDDASSGGSGGAGTGGSAGSGASAGTGGVAGTDGGAGASACEPNVTETCGSCAGLGSRRCAPDGSGWSACECASYGAEIAVSPSGDDSAAGTLAAPFVTLERARQKVWRTGRGRACRAVASWCGCATGSTADRDAHARGRGVRERR